MTTLQSGIANFLTCLRVSLFIGWVGGCMLQCTEKTVYAKFCLPAEDGT